MKTYREYQAEIEEMRVLAEKARKEEISAARQQISEIMDRYGMTGADLEAHGQATKRTPSARPPVPALYRDPSSGATWSGRGRTPLWLKDADRKQFLIEKE